jgi:type VII secretion protein EccB
MPAQVTTRAQVNGYRFVLRRLEHALIRGDSRMIHDPMRGQMRALLVGMVIAVLITGAAGVLAFFKPAPNFGNSTIMLSKASGEIFVRIGDRLHPVLNLASARLIAGKSDPAKEVDDKFLDTVARGSLVGIVGAPAGISGGDDMTRSSWTVCDSIKQPSSANRAAATVETTVLANDPVLGSGIAAASPEQMVIARSGAGTYLLYDGVRAAIDPTNPVLQSALRLADNDIRDVSPALLNAFPLVDPILPISIRGIGEPASYLPAYRVGSVLKTVDSRGDQLFVVLPDGLQAISAATADIIRYSDPRSPTVAEPVAVSPAVVGAAPVVNTLPVDRYPRQSPQFVGAGSDPVVCMAWQHGVSSADSTTRLLVGQRLPIPDDAQPVRLASADFGGPGLDDVYLKPGTGEFVRATGGEPGSRSAGPLFYVTDLGVRFHIKDIPTAAALGVIGAKQPGSSIEVPQSAPWPVLALLPAGPELSQQAALIAHDGLAADPDGSVISPARG